jgi:hypothetical protein
MLITILSLFHLASAPIFATPYSVTNGSFLRPTLDQELLMVKKINDTLENETLLFFLVTEDPKSTQLETPREARLTHQTEDVDPFLQIYLITTALKFLHNSQKNKPTLGPIEGSNDYKSLVEKYSNALTKAYGIQQQKTLLKKIFRENPETLLPILSETVNAADFALQHLKTAAKHDPTARLFLIDLYCDIAEEHRPFFKPGITFSRALSESILKELDNQVNQEEAISRQKIHARLTRAHFLSIPCHHLASASDAAMQVIDFINHRLSDCGTTLDQFLEGNSESQELSTFTSKFSNEEISLMIPTLLKCAFYKAPKDALNKCLTKKNKKLTITLATAFFETGYNILLTSKPGLSPLAYIYLRGIGVPADPHQSLTIMTKLRALNPQLFVPQFFECLFKTLTSPRSKQELPQENLNSSLLQAHLNLIANIEFDQSSILALFYLLINCQNYEKISAGKVSPAIHGHKYNFNEIELNYADVENLNPQNTPFLEKCLLLAEAELDRKSFSTSYNKDKNDWIRFFLGRCYCNGMLGLRNPHKAFLLLSAVQQTVLKDFVKWVCSQKNHQAAIQTKSQPAFCYCAYLDDTQNNQTKMLLGHPSCRLKDQMPGSSQSRCKNCSQKKQIQLPQSEPSSWEDEFILEILDCALGCRYS